MIFYGHAADLRTAAMRAQHHDRGTLYGAHTLFYPPTRTSVEGCLLDDSI